MRLRRKNSLQASKLPRSLRSSALHSHESKVRASPPASDSPETLTKRGKISRVSERSIHKIASPRAHDEKEEGEDFSANRRMTRAMDGEESGKLMTVETPRTSKDLSEEKHQNKGFHRKFRNNALKKAGIKGTVLPASMQADHLEIENISYRKKLRHQEQNPTENGDDKHQAMAADDPRVVEMDNKKLTRLDTIKNNSENGASDSLNDLGNVPFIQDPKKISQARAVLKSLRRQQRVPSAGGVITRHKANSETQAQPLLFVDGESESHQSTRSKHSKKNNRGGGLHDSPALENTNSSFSQTRSKLSAEAKKKKKRPWHFVGLPPRNGAVTSTSLLNNARVLTRTGETQQEGSFQRREGGSFVTREKSQSESDAHRTSCLGDTRLAYTAVDCTHSPNRKLKKQGRGQGNGSSSLEHLKKRRIINRLGDSKQINSNEARHYPIRSPQKALEEGLHVPVENSPDPLVTPRRSKRRRNTACVEAVNDHEATQQMLTPLSKDTNSSENMLQVRDQTGCVAVQDGFYPKGISSSIEHFRGDNTGAEKARSTLKAVENEMGTNSDVFKIEPSSKSCLVATNPTETGGRQMRPRPLDLEQPLLVLVEGANEEYYEFDGGLFYRMLQQHSESKSPSISKVKSNGSNRRTVDVLDATEEKAEPEPIVIPSFRSRMESEESMQIPETPYVLPDAYIKTSSGIKSTQAEYDMDDEDEEWLNNYNQSVSPSSKLSADQFEKIIDLLENKAADVNGNNSITEAFEEDREPVSEECCICNGGENSNDNMVHQCSSCHILVHRSCYGIPKKRGRKGRRKRNWNCRKCEAVAEGQETADISCALCCKQGGALKPTTELHRWAHVVCALYTNETYFVNPDAMEPIDGVDAADARAKRQKRQCRLCGIREGSVERCSVPGCKTVFHVSCGVTQGASFELQHSNHQVISVRVYCPKHALSALGVVQSKPEEQGEKENHVKKQDEEDQNLKENESVDDETLLPVMQELSSHDNLTRKQRKRKALSQCAAFEQGASDHSGKDHTRILEDGCCFGSSTEQGCISRSLKGEQASESAKKGRSICEGVSGEKACEEPMNDGLPGIGNANPGLMEGVYLYWVSKRERQGGALLHRIQQESAARQFNIFNSDDDVGPAILPISEESFPKHSDIDMKVVAARQQLRKLQMLTVLVVQRERLKLDIFLLEQKILKQCLAAFNTGPQCLICKENRFSLVCAVCSRSTCLHCLNRSGSRCKNWLDFLKLPKYVCSDCEKEFNQTKGELACTTPSLNQEDFLAGSFIIHALNKVFGCDKMLENVLISSDKRPFILLPRSDVIQQDKSATEAFWEQSKHKTALISDLLKNPL